MKVLKGKVKYTVKQAKVFCSHDRALLSHEPVIVSVCYSRVALNESDAKWLQIK